MRAKNSPTTVKPYVAEYEIGLKADDSAFGPTPISIPVRLNPLAV